MRKRSSVFVEECVLGGRRGWVFMVAGTVTWRERATREEVRRDEGIFQAYSSVTSPPEPQVIDVTATFTPDALSLHYQSIDSSLHVTIASTPFSKQFYVRS